MHQRMKKAFYVAVALFISTTFASAKFDKLTHHKNTQESCNRLNVKWIGVGKFSSWLTGECVYEGVWTSEPLEQQRRFLLRVTVKKKSGNIFCPKSGKTKFPGQCEHENIIIHTGRGDLYGTLGKFGGEAKGRVQIIPGIKGSLVVKFKRNS